MVGGLLFVIEMTFDKWSEKWYSIDAGGMSIPVGDGRKEWVG